jgi:putative ABC transport system permease protein
MKGSRQRETRITGPPQWAQRFLEWYCRPEVLEDLQGDLNEYFNRNCKSKGGRTASLIYILDVFKFFRSYTIRKPDFIQYLIHWFMLNSYIKTSARSIVRNKLFSFINIAGLAISMSVGLLMIGVLLDMSRYDRFNDNYDRIYRLISKYKHVDHEGGNYCASTSMLAAKAVRESIPGIEQQAIFYNGVQGDFTAGDKTIYLNGLWADESVLSVFSFPFLHGNAPTALRDPYSIVLTETSAKKLFGETDVIGRTVSFVENREIKSVTGKQEFVVTGVVKDIPKFSHVKFEMLTSLSTREITERENKQEMSWDNVWSTYVYLVLPEKTDLDNFQRNLNVLCAQHNKTVKNMAVELSLQPLSEIALGEDMNNPIGAVMGKADVWILSILAIIVILSACFNYTNLSIARSLRRSREVGIRKVIGALKSHVLGQFIVESIIISLMALVLGFGLFIILKPFFLSLKPRLQEMLDLQVSPEMILYFVLLAIAVGILAGIIPALFFSRMNAIQVLKNAATVRMFKNVSVRKALIVIQYTISLIFIATTMIVFKQYKYFLAFDLGYSTENIVNIKLQGNKAELLVKELAEIPEVKGTSSSILITSVGNYWGSHMKYNDPRDSAVAYYNFIDENYIPLHDIKLIAGRNFTTKPNDAPETEVIVNEKALQRFRIADGDPLKALDEIVTVDNNKLKIIGVIKDFHYGKADNEKQEVILRYSKNNFRFVNAKVITDDWLSTFGKIEKAWKKIDNVHPLDARLYDEQIKTSYAEISAMVKTIGFLAILAISISTMGLLGMVVFTTETRVREISIRKVLGATESMLIFLLSKAFLTLLLMSSFIALPLTYFFFDQIALAEFANHAPVNFSELLLGALAVILIASLMIVSQTLKAARGNPAEVLKNE